MRFPIRIDRIWRAPVLIGGATKQNSYVEVTDGEVSFRYGALFNRTMPKSEIVDAYTREWPWWYGIGWRSDLRGVIGLVGSYQNVVEVKLASRSRAWGVFPCDRIAVSVEDPAGFIAAVKGNGASEGQADLSEPEAQATKPKRKTTKRAKKAKAAEE
jgi:hypothetical protein